MDTEEKQDILPSSGQSETSKAVEVTEDDLTNAENGSEEHQLKVGEFYLKKSELQTGQEAQQTAEKGVKWLILSSRSGNKKATEDLAKCLDTSHGVSDRNLSDVSWCVQTPPLEKVARTAAKQLFQAINPLQSREMSKNDYLKSIEDISSSKAEKKLLEKAAKFKDMEGLSEEAFVDKVVCRLNGYGGISLDSLLQSDVEWEAYRNATWFQKVTRYSGKSMTLLIDKTVESAGSQGMVWLRSMIPTNQIYMLFAFFLYSLLSVQLVLWFIPLFVFYISLAATVLCTMQMFYSKRKMKDVKVMAVMLNRFNKAVDCDTAESSYEWNKLTPYLSYFTAIGLMAASFAMSDKSWIPCSELVVISLFFTFTCFMALSDKYDYLSLLSILLDFISTLPYFIEGLPRLPLVTSLLNLFCGSVYSVEIFEGMYVNLGLPSLAYMIVPLLFIKMAIQKSWTGTYRVLIPHLVCFFWWKVSVMFYRYSTWYGLIRGSVGWIFLVALLPIFIIMFAFWLLFYGMSIFTLSNIIRVITTIILLSFPIAFGVWAKSGFKIRSFSLHEKSVTAKTILIFLFILSVIPMIYYFTPPERDVDGKYITWEQYKQYCSKPRWDQTNIAESMIVCSHFKYSMVHWTGKIKKVTIREIFNQADQFLQYMPFIISNWIKCTYGSAYPKCSEIEDYSKREICELSTMQNKGNCHLQNMNKYTFEIWVKMSIDNDNEHDIKLIATDWFKDTVLQINENDEVSFRGSLQNNLGNIWPELRLYYIKCNTCEGVVAYGSKSFLSETSLYVVNVLKKGAFETWNFFFAPVVELYTGNDNKSDGFENM